MNNNLCLLCVRCKKIARFICERCSDPYCTKACQVLDWPLHRKICFPMPSLLEIPDERNMICDSRNNEPLALTYHTNSPNRYGSKNNGRNNNGYQRPNRNQPFTKPVRQELCDWEDSKLSESANNPAKDSKNSNSLIDIPQCLPTDLQKFDCQKTPSVSDGIINLAELKESKSQKTTSTESKNEPLPSKRSSNWDVSSTGHENKLEPLMSNDSTNWQKPFQLENDTLVTVVYFVENPTNNCWIVPQKYVKKRNYLHDELKRLHSIDANTGSHRIITNEVYSVQYEDSYYRGVCLYQINSKEVLVRLIDVGLIFQTQIGGMKRLDPRLKTINAFAFEINFETKLNVTVGQTLRIKRFALDATGTMIVELEQDEKITLPDDESLQIETEPLPVGVPLELFCLDYSYIENGYISACIHDPVKIESINQLSDKIKDYVLSLRKAGGDAYFPKSGEVCFAYHDVEHQWYRAECVNELSSDSFEVLFIDYGSTKIVASSSLRKFATGFTQPAIMHFCCIKGAPSRPTKELIKKMTEFFNENPFFTIESATSEDGIMIIDCPKLTKAINF